MSAQRKHLAAIVKAIQSVDPSRRGIFLEELISELEQSNPGVASMASTLAAISNDEDENLRVLLAGLVDRAPSYAGEPFEEPLRAQVDVLILTIKEPELLACLEAYGLKEADGLYSPGRKFRYWTWMHGGKTHVLSNVGVAGNAYATLKMMVLAEHFIPQLAVLIGMAAGVPAKAHLGDVVVAQHVYNYEYAILTDEGLAQAAESWSPPLLDIDPIKAENLQEAWRTAVRGTIRTLRTRFSRDGEMPSEEHLRGARMKLHVEPIMAGGWLIESDELTTFARSIQAQIVASEMDGAGFAVAAKHLGWNWFVVRGIADSGAPGREQNWQRFATFAAAVFCRDVLVPDTFGKLDLQGKAR
jgi:nucleoside phosphorylase